VTQCDKFQTPLEAHKFAEPKSLLQMTRAKVYRSQRTRLDYDDLQVSAVCRRPSMTTNAVLKLRLQDHFENHPDNKQHDQYSGLSNTRGRTRPTIVSTGTCTSNDLPAPAQPTAGPSRHPQCYQPYPPPSFAPYTQPTPWMITSHSWPFNEI
jgi:hypothetical protein